MAVIEQFAGSFFNLTHTVASNPKVLVVSQTLGLRQDVLKNIRTRTVRHLIGFNDLAEVRSSVKNVSVSDQLGLFQRSAKAPLTAEAFDFFFPYHSADPSKGGTTESFLNLQQTVLVYVPNSANQSLTFSQAVVLQCIRNRIVTQTFSINSYTNEFIYDVNRGVLIDYPEQVPATTVTFSYMGFDLTIPAPDFGNALKLEFSRVSQKTRGNDSIIFRPDIWPRSRILNLKFSYLTEVQANNMKYLLKTTLGKNLNYTDHLGRVWTGIILTPAAPMIQTMRNVFEITLEYQAERVG